MSLPPPTHFVESAISSALYNDPLKEKPLAVERSVKLGSALMGVADGEHVSASVPLGQRDTTPKTAYAVGELAYDSWIDEPVVNPASGAAFGRKCVIRFGLNGYTYLNAAEVVFKVTLVSTTGGIANRARWPAYLAERLMGNSYTIKHANSDVVEKRNVVAEHFKRQLEFDQSSEAWNSYQDAVRAVPSNNQVTDVGKTITCYYPVTMPYTKQKPLVQTAHSAEHELSFEIPAIMNLLWDYDANIDSANGQALSFTSANATIEVFLRCHVTELDQQARAEITEHTLVEGLKYHVTEIEDSQAQVNATPVGTAAAGAAVTVTSGDLGFVQPSAYLLAVLRYASDAAGIATPVPTETGSNNPLSVTSVAAAVDFFSQNGNLTPNPFAAVPPISWVLKENGTNFMPEMTWDYYNKRIHNKLFNSENYQPTIVVPFTNKPLLATDHSVGHVTHTNLRKPQLSVTFRKYPTTGDEDGAASGPLVDVDLFHRHFMAATPDYRPASTLVPAYPIAMVLDTWSVNYNFLVKKAARIYKMYQ